MKIRLTASLIAALFAGAACSGNSISQPPIVPIGPVTPPLSTYIKHVVIIVQENRSFENMFAGWPGADAPMSGYKLVNGKRVKVPLTVMTYAQDQDMCHVWKDAITAYDGGKMDGFNLERGFLQGSCGLPLSGSLPYRYMDHTEIAPYRTLASQYVLADHMFPTEFGTSFTAHQDLIAGTAEIDPQHSLVNTPTNMPWGCDAPRGTRTQLVNKKQVVSPPTGPFPCITQYQTMADTLDAAGASWKYYAPPLDVQSGSIWTAFDAIKSVRYGSDWKKVVTPNTKALSDFAKGDLPAVSWVVPDLAWADYPAVPLDYGPSWVGDVINAIGKSKEWKSTAIVVLWDDWGGFYDNEPPPQLDYVGLAIRVPCLIVSPYAKKGYVSHTQYEYGSILKFVEQAFNLDSLHATDVRANSLIDSFDFTQKPRAFVPIKTKYNPAFFFSQVPSLRPPDDD
jgi:phospholipase C